MILTVPKKPCQFTFEVWTFTILDNLDHFFFFKSKYSYSEKFVHLLECMLEHAQWFEVEIVKLQECVQRFDVDESVPGNGFRSFSIIFDRFFKDCYVFCKEMSTVRDSMAFMSGVYLERLKARIQVLNTFKLGLTYILKMIDENDSTCPLVINKNITAEEIINDYGLLDQTAFYGRCQGFYLCSSMRKTLWGVSVLMAAFSDLYQQPGGPLSRAVSAVLNGIKYILDPEKRSQQIVSVAQNSSVEFLQAFWSLSETHFMKVLPKWICPTLEVLEELWVPAEPISIDIEDGFRSVQVPVPTSHLPPAPIRCLLMSYVQRKGQIANQTLASSKNAPLSPALLFHCHGGGFVSQTPESHEIYLRHWACDLNVPILSVDYSLSPQAPFPRALEEVLLTYIWALKNPEKLGWTGERVCFAGDSAGGNILMGVIIKLITLKLRKPDAVLCAYSPLILDLIPSPSRLLCWMDPLLPIGFMISCLDAYIGAMQTDSDEYTEKDTKERKLSSISDIYDSGRMFFKEVEWAEIEAEEPDEKESLGGEDVSDSPKRAENLKESMDLNDRCQIYLNDFFNNYCSFSQQQLSEGQNDSKEHCLFSVQDILYVVKEKCNGLVNFANRKIVSTVQQNRWYQTFIAPFIPSKLFQTKAAEIKLPQAEVSIVQKIKRLKLVSRNPYISPLLASEEILKEMPQIYFISLNFDPCLDDSITFSKRMTAVGKPVVIDVLDGLPHGFLNFLPFCQEAHDGSNVCVKRIKQALKLPES